jgi:DNA repair protein RadC
MLYIYIRKLILNKWRSTMKRISVITLKQVRERTVLYETNRIMRPEDAAGIIHKVFEPEHEPVETFGILSLNTKNEVVGAHQLGKGTVNAAIATPREVFKAALMNNAISVILFHNHPSGDTTPSNEDLQLTRRMMEAGEVLGIDVLDHIITGYAGDFRSLKAAGMM